MDVDASMRTKSGFEAWITADPVTGRAVVLLDAPRYDYIGQMGMDSLGEFENRSQ